MTLKEFKHWLAGYRAGSLQENWTKRDWAIILEQIESLEDPPSALAPMTPARKPPPFDWGRKPGDWVAGQTPVLCQNG